MPADKCSGWLLENAQNYSHYCPRAKLRAGVCVVRWCSDPWAATSCDNTPSSSDFSPYHQRYVA